MTYPNLPRCQWCGDMFLSELALDVHKPKCPSNPNKPPAKPKDDE